MRQKNRVLIPEGVAADRARRVIAISGRIPLVNLTDDQLAAWLAWFALHDENEFTYPRQKSYFRINKANVIAERMWRNKEIPF